MFRKLKIKLIKKVLIDFYKWQEKELPFPPTKECYSIIDYYIESIKDNKKRS